MCGNGCVPVALQLLVWGVFIYDHVRRFVEHCFEQNLPSTLPKKAQLGCESTIAICGMNAICGISIRMCAPTPFVTQLLVHPHSQTYECILLYLCAYSRFYSSGSLIVINYASPDCCGWRPTAEIVATVAILELPRGCNLAPQTLLRFLLHRQGEEVEGVTP